MKPRFSVVRDLDGDVWRRFVFEHPYGSVFHEPAMYRVFAMANGYSPELWAARDDEGIAALFLPVRVCVFPGMAGRLTARDIAYAGPLCAPGERGTAALAHLLRAYSRSLPTLCMFTEVRHLVDPAHTDGVLCASGFRRQDNVNYLIDLSGSEQDLLQRFGRRTRKQVRRAMRADKVQVREAHGQEGVETAYRLVRMSYDHAHMPMGDVSLFHAAHDVLSHRGMLRTAVAYVDGAAVASSLDLCYKQTVYGWFGGMDRAYGSFCPNEILTWNVLSWAQRQGYLCYDFGGGGDPNQSYGVRSFKAKFGGELVSFGRHIRVHSWPTYAASRAGYGVLRRMIWRRRT